MARKKPAEPTPQALRAIALRKRYGWTQEGVADRSGGAMKRLTVRGFEDGTNLGTSAKVLEGYATAFALTFEQVRGYLSGKIPLEDLPNIPPEPHTPAVEIEKFYGTAEAARIAERRFPDLASGKRYGPERAIAACWLVDLRDMQPTKAQAAVMGVQTFDEKLTGGVLARVAEIVGHVLEHRGVRSSKHAPPGAKWLAGAPKGKSRAT